MNNIDKVRELVLPEYNRLKCWVHGWQHIKDVAKNAKRLAELEKADIDSCIIAALCHDLGRIEEEKRRVNGEPALPHALLSIEPTIKILQEAGISGIDFDKIIEAVAVHSYKNYDGNNIIAKILRDADKIGSGFGDYRILALIKDWGYKDYFPAEEIINNKNNPKKLRELCEESLSQLDGLALEKVKKGINFLLEWFGMFQTESAKSLMLGEDKYFREIRNLLMKSI